MGPGELTDEKPARAFGGTTPFPTLDESQRAAAKPWVMLFTVASFGRALVPIGAIFACRMRWIGPKTAVSVVFTNYIVLQYTVMLARCAVHRIAEVEQPGWFWAIATSGILAVLCLAVWLA